MAARHLKSILFCMFTLVWLCMCFLGWLSAQVQENLILSRAGVITNHKFPLTIGFSGWLCRNWFSHSNGTALTQRKSLSIRSTHAFAKSCRRLSEHLPKVTQNYPLLANWRGQIPRRNNKRRLERVLLKRLSLTPWVVCKFGWKRTLLFYTFVGGGGGVVLQNIIRTFLCRSNTSFLHGKFYCVGAVHFIALWLCKMQSSGWANLRRRRRSSNTMLLFIASRFVRSSQTRYAFNSQNRAERVSCCQ